MRNKEVETEVKGQEKPEGKSQVEGVDGVDLWM